MDMIQYVCSRRRRYDVFLLSVSRQQEMKQHSYCNKASWRGAGSTLHWANMNFLKYNFLLKACSLLVIVYRCRILRPLCNKIHISLFYLISTLCFVPKDSQQTDIGTKRTVNKSLSLRNQANLNVSKVIKFCDKITIQCILGRKKMCSTGRNHSYQVNRELGDMYKE